VGQLKHLEGNAVLKPVDAGDTVADLQHGTRLFGVDLACVLLDLLAKDLCDLVWAKLHRLFSRILGEWFYGSRYARVML
jgi:hypothetical protein